ncbi:MAG: UPF0149 family protein [Thermodesulfobium sp.]
MKLVSNNPLSLNEIRLLNDFLCASYEEASPMNFTTAHGFLCAIQTCPNLIMPSLWQPILLGGHPEFSSEKQLITIMDLILRLSNQISEELRRSGTPFNPLILYQNEIVSYERAPLELISEWCTGYLAGTRLDPLWASNEDAVTPLIIFAILSGQFDLTKKGKDEKGNPIQDDTPYKEKMRLALPNFIAGLYNFWKEERQRSNPIYGDQAPHFRAGRNDPCPCGSGNKYKKCCLPLRPPLH